MEAGTGWRLLTVFSGVAVVIPAIRVATEWWNKHKLYLIPSPNIAAKLFDFMVNAGPVTAIKVFQDTLNELVHDGRAMLKNRSV